MSGFLVLAAGIQASIQDRGRFGYGSIGVSQAGAMDEFAFHWANRLLGNAYNTNALEITLGGVKLKAQGETTFVLTGATCSAHLDAKAIELWKTYTIRDAQILDIGFASSGVRLYLGVAGGFDIDPDFGSNSSSIKEGIGMGVLKAKDFLPFTCSPTSTDHRRISRALKPDYEAPLVLRLLPGYQWGLFSKSEREKFFASTYEVSAQNDRMGYRLAGPKIQPSIGGIISEPIAFGSVQIPSHGEPIVLLKERQTIGGYPKIGAVIPADCFALAQAKSGAKIRFAPIDSKEARASSLDFYNFFMP